MWKMWPAMEIATTRVVHKYRGRRLVLKFWLQQWYSSKSKGLSLALIEIFVKKNHLRRRKEERRDRRRRQITRSRDAWNLWLRFITIKRVYWNLVELDDNDKDNLKWGQSDFCLLQDCDEIKPNEGESRGLVPSNKVSGGRFPSFSIVHILNTKWMPN